jgi:hypothetical protein
VTESISITSPLPGSTVSGTTTVTTHASSSIGISKVLLYVDGTLYTVSTTSPYTFSWDTTRYAGGTHSLYAVMYDASNHALTSGTVTVTLRNTP